MKDKKYQMETTNKSNRVRQSTRKIKLNLRNKMQMAFSILMKFVFA